MSLRSCMVVVTAWALAACGDSGTAAPAVASDAAPYAVVVGARGVVRAEVRTAPSPPTHGVISVELTLRAADTDALIDNVQVEMQPWMSAMGHGASVHPTIEARGQGRYLAHNVDVFMPGRWELRTTLSGAVEDTLALVVDVP